MLNTFVQNAVTECSQLFSFDIIPCNSFNENLPRYSLHIKDSIKILLCDLLDKKILALATHATKTMSPIDIHNFKKAFLNTLPFLNSNISESKHASNVALTTICSAKNTLGAGRHIADICSKWFIPGKLTPLSYVFSYVFSFSFDPQHQYLMHQINGNLTDKKDSVIIKKTLPIINKEIKITIQAVQKAREIIAKDTLCLNERKTLIYQNIESLIKSSTHRQSRSVYDHIHHLFLKLSSEKKTALISEQVAPLSNSPSNLFQRDIFADLQNFLVQFQEEFIVKRKAQHISKLISNIYLFKKEVLHHIALNPKKRFLKTAILNSKYEDNKTPFIGLLICINILKPNEIIAKEHIESALKEAIQSSFQIQFFSSVDKAPQSIKLLYFEIQKIDISLFNNIEISNLQSQLIKSIKVHIKRNLNHVFMARNEEEIFKNVVTLSKQLKYVHDIPQIMINFHRQTDEDLIFTIIILRIKKDQSYCLQEKLTQCKQYLNFNRVKVNIVGYLRKNYQKQACVFDLQLKKKPFLRQDFSVDLYDARSFIYSTLSNALGPIRDFNGGMFSKQHEVYALLKNQILSTEKIDEFSLKNFFYNICPAHMQGVLEVSLLKESFLFMNRHQELKTEDEYFLCKKKIGRFFLLLINSSSQDIGENIANNILKKKHVPDLEAKSVRSTHRSFQILLIFTYNIKKGLDHFYSDPLSVNRKENCMKESTRFNSKNF